jgi:FkbM family methyltransferase
MAQERPLSYAQNMEDYHLSLAFAGNERGTYVDVGGGHPVAGSVTFWFYKRGWSGVVVEPQSDLAHLHRKLRPRDSVAQCLIGADNSERDFYVFDRLHGLSTTIGAYARAASAQFRTVRLPSMSLAELCRSHHLDAIDFLKIDVEGAEAEVVAGADWDRFRPGIVLVESIAPISGEPTWHQWEELLLANGYRFALFDTLNRFYVADERADLLAKMPTERAPWDAVLHLYEIGRAAETAIHPDHVLAQHLERGFWASLPLLDEAVLQTILRRGLELNGIQPDKAEPDVTSETFRASIGLIASAYDGGFVDEGIP